MSGLKELKNRIQSVKNTQQITRAMKMVAASKLRKAEHQITNARHYSERVTELIRKMAHVAGKDIKLPYFEQRERGKAVLILITSDRGLCGGLNTNLCKMVSAEIQKLEKDYDEVELYCFGKKGRDYFRNRKRKIAHEVVQLKDDEKVSAMKKLIESVRLRFEEEEVNAVYVAHNQFKSVINQTPRMINLLPVIGSAEDLAQGEAENTDFIFEPNPQHILKTLIGRFVDNVSHAAVLDHIACEHGARMSAMDSATKNAGEMISKLRLFYNRARQAAITTELSEIVSGAESIK